jgi:hypothetical protein
MVMFVFDRDSALAVKPVRAVHRSGNGKTGNVNATYVSQASCPPTCPFIDGRGCYANVGRVGMITHALNKSEEHDPVELARQEAKAIDGLPADLPLRMHVVGDSTTARGTKLLAAAARRYRHRSFLATDVAQPVWTYTHSWRTVARKHWGDVSVLASCETADQVVKAHGRGYAPCLVVETLPADGKAYDLPGAPGFKVIPCPEVTRGVSCVDCGLCMRADTLHRNKTVIGFAAGYQAKNRARVALKMAGEQEAGCV